MSGIIGISFPIGDRGRSRSASLFRQWTLSIEHAGRHARQALDALRQVREVSVAAVALWQHHGELMVGLPRLKSKSSRTV
jgi:hypothetical protein